MTVINPISAAPMISRGEFRLWAIKKPMTMPGRMEWLMASLMRLIFRKTRKTPGSAQAAAVITAIS